ncbi:hypothetical protein AB0I91_36915 [Actinosynnema sp. NPDC049800]
MSSTPIYDELAATYLADLIPTPGEPVEPEPPGGQAPAPATGTTDRPQPRPRPKV